MLDPRGRAGPVRMRLIIRLIGDTPASMQPFAAIGRHLAMVRWNSAENDGSRTIRFRHSTCRRYEPQRSNRALYGIESPGLTASLAISEHAAQLAGG
jgi:hypothetical protein